MTQQSHSWASTQTKLKFEKIHAFLHALFTTAKTWKQPKCPPIEEWIKKMWYTMEYHSAIKNVLFFVCFLGPCSRHMEVARLEVELELQLPATAMVTATWDLSYVSNVQHSSWQCQTLNPLSEAKGRTCILMDTTWVCNPLSHNGNSPKE